jgi:hypothetical protein
MVRNTFFQVGKVTLGVGVSMRFGLGFCVDKWSVNLDLGPFWLFIEW